MPAEERFADLIERGLVELRNGEFTAAEKIFADAAATAPNESDRTLVQIHEASAAVLDERSSLAVEALPHLLLRGDTPHHVFLAAYYLIMHLCHRGEAGRAAWYVPHILSAADALSDPVARAGAYESAAAVALTRHEYEKAKEYSIQALNSLPEEVTESRAILMRAASLNDVGYAYLGLGQRTVAVQYLEESITVLESAGLVAYTTEPYLNLAFAAVAMGKTDCAAAALATLDARKSHLNVRLLKYLYYLRGELLDASGDHAGALENYKQLQTFYPNFANITDTLAAIRLLPLLLPE